jgi:ABC-2 type transport system ATP-binding protein
MLEVRHLTKQYSRIKALDDVSFTAAPGEVTGYLGPNGSGLIAPSEGEILYDGKPIQRDIIAYKKRLGYVPEEPYLYPHLTGAEYLELIGDLHGVPPDRLQEKIAGLLRLFSLYGDRYVPLSSYSKGMRQKILVSAALLHNPEIVILDEPFSGLDVSSAMILRSLIQSLAAEGKVVLFSSHVLDVVERVCSRVVILHNGRVAANDSIANLRGLMSLPTLEDIFSQLAVEQDTGAITREMIELITL